MRFLKYAFPIAIIVGTFSWFMIGNSYEEVAADMRVYISIAAALFAGLISAVLFREEKEEKIDPKK